MKKDVKKIKSMSKNFGQNSHILVDLVAKNGRKSLDIIVYVWKKNVDFAQKTKFESYYSVHLRNKLYIFTKKLESI